MSLRALYAVMIKAKRGESMETVTCNVTASTMDGIKSWAESIGSNVVLINKNDPSRYNMPLCITVCGGTASSAFRGRNGILQSVNFSSIYDADVRDGDVFYIFRPE